MLTLNNITLPVTATDAELWAAVRRELKGAEVKEIKLLKKSIDARDKGKLLYVYRLAVALNEEDAYLRQGYAVYEDTPDTLSQILNGKRYQGSRPIVVGAGPAGLFAALALSYLGAKPLIIERGERVEERTATVKQFFDTQTLDFNSNVQFGEGGAGTFSDGKLASGITHPLTKTVLKEFVLSGAPSEILYLNKPHIGTDRLTVVVKTMRERILALGGEFLFSTTMTDLLIKDGRVRGVRTSRGDFDADAVYLAIGHSARDTFEMLYGKGLRMEQKAFSIGLRLEHLQDDIGYAQYGKDFRLLPPADYKLAVHLPNGRSLYTFCMCPGGRVVNAASEREGIAVNGMSEYSRDGKNANSAVLVGVTPADFSGESPLAGMEFQRRYERKAFSLVGGYRPPVQLYGDFLKGRVSQRTGGISPTAAGYAFADLRACLPVFVAESIADGVKLMAKRLRGFDRADGVLTGVESRSSSPLRILRDELFQSSLCGLFPIGEGAGYAGGITSSAVDGLKAVLSSQYIL